MVTLLGKEQATDDKQKDFCIAELDKEDDAKKELESGITDAAGAISKQADQIAEVADQIQALREGIETLDHSVAASTAQRKSEHAEHLSQAAANQAAVKLLGMAKNMLNKFYNPEEYRKPDPKPELVQEQDGNKVSDGFSVEQQSQGDGIIFVQVRSHSEGPGAASGVMGMMDQLAHGVEMDIQQAKMEDQEAQKEYEVAMTEATAKRAADSQLIVTKEAEKAELTAVLEDQKVKKSMKTELLASTAEKIGDLHNTCDYLLENFDALKKARAAESEGLKQSKAVLSGASFGGFMQRSH